MASTLHQSERLKPVMAILQQLSLSADQERLLESFVRVFPESIGADRCSLFILDPVQRRLWLKCGTGMIERELDIPVRGSISGEAVATGEAQRVNDLTHHIGVHTDVEMMTGYRTHNVLSVPITSTAGDMVRGVLQVLNKKGDEGFTEQDEETTRAICENLRPVARKYYYAQNLSPIDNNEHRDVLPVKTWLLLTAVITTILTAVIFVLS